MVISSYFFLFFEIILYFFLKKTKLDRKIKNDLNI